ncbi:MAG: DUF5615 family PIN-like protein [Planctomycetaceae bacterium]|nr:DUF5615 family PIN-like protein [Planctomycetaceae bacterium]
MRLLLDENIPVAFARQITLHEVSTVQWLGWSGIKNGELMRRAGEVCDVFITLDRNLEYQQDVTTLSFSVIVLVARSSRIADLSPLIPELLRAVERARAGKVLKVSC